MKHQNIPWRAKHRLKMERMQKRMSEIRSQLMERIKQQNHDDEVSKILAKKR